MPRTCLIADVLDRDSKAILTIRERLPFQVAAGLDRVERAQGSIEGDPRWRQLAAAIQEIAKAGDDRAERFQMAFSDHYDANWKEEYGITDRS
jgi:hypothetical protein